MSTRLALVLLAAGIPGEIASTDDLGFGNATLSRSALTAPRVFTLPDATGTVALLERAQSFTADQVFLENVQIGAQPYAGNAALTVSDPTAGWGATSAQGVLSRANVTSGVTTDYSAFESNGSTENASFTTTDYRNFYAKNVNKGASHTITHQVGFDTNDLSVGTNNYAFRTAITAGAAKWSLYASGGAKSYHSGSLLIGSSTDTGEKLQVTGTSLFTGNATFNANITANGGFVHVDRAGDGASASYLISSDAGFARQITFRTGSAARWNWVCTATAESGSDAGSDWQLTSHNDAGTSLGSVITIMRATRVVNFTVAPTFTDATTTRSNLGAAGLVDSNTFTTGLNTFQGNQTYRLWGLRGTVSGRSAITQDMYGVLLTAGDMSGTAKYTPGILFGSTDANFTSPTPKWSAGIFGYATEAYAADTDGGMGLEFLGTANDPGASHVPTSLGTWHPTGFACATAATFASTVGVGNTLTIDRVGDAAGGTFVIDVDAGQTGQVNFATAGANRWIVRKGATAEGGANSGSPYELHARDDAGGALGTVYTSQRDTRILAITVGATVPNTAIGDNSTTVPNTAFVNDALNRALTAALLRAA